MRSRPGYATRKLQTKWNRNCVVPREADKHGEKATRGHPMKIVQSVVAEINQSARTQAAEWEVIYRHAPVGLAVYDRNLRFVRVNDALAKFHNLLPAKHIGRHVEEVN